MNNPLARPQHFLVNCNHNREGEREREREGRLPEVSPRNHRSKHFIDFEIDAGISEGETLLDLHNEKLMVDEETNEVRVDASRGKLAANKKKVVFN